MTEFVAVVASADFAGPHRSLLPNQAKSVQGF
jgi:hypothetical protein